MIVLAPLQFALAVPVLLIVVYVVVYTIRLAWRRADNRARSEFAADLFDKCNRRLDEKEQ